MNRGHVVEVNWPYSDLSGTKVRPAVVVRSDSLAGLIDDTILVKITGSHYSILRPDNLGNLTHTFTPDRGILGGQIVPFCAVRFDKLLTPKRDSVTSFVESFGLSHREAEDVVSAVGTAP